MLDMQGQLESEKAAREAGSITPDTQYKGLMQGQDQSKYLQDAQDSQARKMSALGGDTAMMSKALQSKTNKQAAIGYNQQSTLAKAQAPVESYNKVHHAMNMQNQVISSINEESALAQRRVNLLQQKSSNEKQMRSSTLGSILGLAGTIGGIAVGGPGGAMAGGAIGSNAGQGLAGGI